MDQAVSIVKRERAVVVYNHPIKLGIAFSWECADELVRAIQRPGNGRDTVDSDVAVLRDPERIVVEYKGSVFLDVLRSDWIPINAIVGAVTQQARLIEEEEKAEQITLDGAILFKSGAPFGLTDNPYLKDRIGNEAAFGELPRKMPIIGIPSGEVVGTPTVGQRPADETLEQRLSRMSPREKEIARKLLNGGSK